MTDTDEHLARLLRSAVPPARRAGPSRDLWPLIADRIDAPVRWSPLDIGLSVAVAIVLLVFREGLLLLAYHL
jgi:hypothetical protein